MTAYGEWRVEPADPAAGIMQRPISHDGCPDPESRIVHEERSAHCVVVVCSCGAVYEESCGWD